MPDHTHAPNHLEEPGTNGTTDRKSPARQDGALAERVESLEADLRSLRAAFREALGHASALAERFVAVEAFVGAPTSAAGLSEPLASSGANGSLPTLQVRQLEVLDDAGQVRAVIGDLPYWGKTCFGVDLRAPDGTTRVTINADDVNGDVLVHATAQPGDTRGDAMVGMCVDDDIPSVWVTEAGDVKHLERLA